METFCDHDAESDDDDLLLNNTGIKNRTTSNSCIKCRKQGNSSMNYKDSGTYNDFKPILEIQEAEWFETRNGMVKSSIPIAHSANMSINLDDNIDAPLLINSHCNSFENTYLNSNVFHCHMEFEHDDDKAWKKLTAVCCMCIIFMLTELIGGYLAGSLAIMTDAAHLLSDIVGFVLSLISILISKKPPTNSMTFGYHRAEVLGALFSVMAVWLLAGSCAVLAVGRLIRNDYDINANTMLVVSALGVLINIFMGAILHGVFHSHDAAKHHHGHSHARSHDSENINVRAAAAHVLGDLLQSVGVLVAAAVIKFYPQAKAADPLCTLLFSVVVVWATLRVARDAVTILLESSAGGGSSAHDVQALKSLLQSLLGVRHVHNLNLWTLSPGKDAISVHLAVDSNCDRDLLLIQASNVIRNKLKTISCTIQIEIYNEDLISSCQECQR